MTEKLIQVAPGKVKILSNVRKTIDKSTIPDLAKSIKENGLIEPIIVRKGKGNTYELQVGQRRLLASRVAKEKTIPAILREYDDKELPAIQLVENTGREDLTPLEIAEGYLKMSEESLMTNQEIAIKMNINIKEVKHYLSIKNLHPKLYLMVKQGELNLDQALAAAKFSLDIQEIALKEFKHILTRWDPREIENRLVELFTGDMTNPGFDMEDLTLGIDNRVCSKCSFNGVKNKDLFGDGLKLCGDIKCYNNKRELTINNTITKFKHDGEKYYLISEGRIDKYNQHEVLQRSEYEFAEKDSKCVEFNGIIIDGRNFGRVKKIILKSAIKNMEKKEREKILKTGKTQDIEKIDSRVNPDVKYWSKIELIDETENVTMMKNINKRILEGKEYAPDFATLRKLFVLLIIKSGSNVVDRISKFYGIERWDIEEGEFENKIKSFDDLVKVIISSVFDYDIPRIELEDLEYSKILDFGKHVLSSKTIKDMEFAIKTAKETQEKELEKKFEERWGRKPIQKLKNN
jgi:ParB/RepB/Spo0J family partition protein